MCNSDAKAPFILLGLGLLFSLPEAGSGQHLSQPTREVLVGHDFSNKPVAKWENGFLVAYEHDYQPPSLFAFDRNGSLVTQTSITIPDAVRISLRGPSASLNGTLAVAGTALTSQGAGATFIAWVNPSGSIDRLVRTTPFAALKLCFSEDGTLWAVGNERSANLSSEQTHNVLRHYDSQGKLVNSLLPRTGFSGGDHPALDSYLVCSNNRIGFYSVSAGEWVEVSTAGQLLGRWKGLIIGKSDYVTGVGITSGESVYISIRRSNPAKAGYSIPEYYRLDRISSSWLTVQRGPQEGAIYGSDADELIMATRPTKFVWVKPE